MKFIKQFENFTNEAKIDTNLNEIGLAIIIDDNGRIMFDDDDEYEMGILFNKGEFDPFNEELKKTKNIVAGIDHNGKFYSLFKDLQINQTDIENAKKSMGIRDINFGRVWGELPKRLKSYKELLRKDLTTNINQKVDLEATKKITYRYSRILAEIVKSSDDGIKNVKTLFDRILDLITIDKAGSMSNEIKKIAEDLNLKRKAQLSNCIYNLINQLASIRYYTNASSAGFFFEEFIAALTDGIAVGGFGREDIMNQDGKLQCKLYQESSRIDLSKYKGVKYLIIGIKAKHVIKIYEFSVPELKKNSELKSLFGGYGTISAKALIATMKDYKPKEIHFNKMNNILKSIAGDTNVTVDTINKIQKKVYKNIKNIHNDIDSVFMGIDDRNNKVNIDIKAETIKDDIETKTDDIIDNISKFLNIEEE
jgi:hypothetical protein